MNVIRGGTMKIIKDEFFDTEEKIYKLINKSEPSSNYTFTVENFKELAGWVYITGKINKSEYSINYSSAIFDHYWIIKFFAEIINLKDEIVIFLDYEGSYPMLYAKKADNNTVRFIFAHDYILFENDENDDDCLPLYKIECDIQIDKKELLEKFYNIINPHIMNYDEKNNYDFDIKKAKKYLKQIKIFLDKKSS